MRHQNKTHHLGRTASHRKRMMSHLAASLIEHKRITTTLPKAKALRTYVEPLLTKAKNDSVHSRRHVFSKLTDKHAVKELFQEVRPKIMERPGGYTRILKLGPRKGDNAEMALIELVDFNEFDYSQNKGETKKKSTRRRRRGKKKSGGSEQQQAGPQAETTGAAAAASSAEGDSSAAAAPTDAKTQPGEASSATSSTATEATQAEGEATASAAPSPSGGEADEASSSAQDEDQPANQDEGEQQSSS
jgi:large subunit ribosomal protein L17